MPRASGRTGTPEGIRTPDPRLRRPLLYPTELLAHRMEQVTGIEPASPAWKAGALAIVLHLRERLPKHCQLIKNTTPCGRCQAFFTAFLRNRATIIHAHLTCSELPVLRCRRSPGVSPPRSSALPRKSGPASNAQFIIAQFLNVLGCDFSFSISFSF